jgi:hypothetical protein
MFASANLTRARRARRRLRLSSLYGALTLLASMLAAAALTGCSYHEKLKQPSMMVSPYDHPQLWAVVPFTNESGVSVVQTDHVADLFTEQAEEIDGIATVPVNRVIVAMRRLNMRSVATPADAMSLMRALGVDGLIVGTVTSYEPYPPLKLGAAIQLYRNESQQLSKSLDPVEVTRAPTEHIAAGMVASNPSAAQASGVFDASNHQTLAWLNQYAAGRAAPDSAYGERIYLASMEMFTQFVAYRLLHDLLDSERIRLQPPATEEKPR